LSFEFDYRILSKRLRIIFFIEVITRQTRAEHCPMDADLRMAHNGRERERTYSKQQHGKTRAIKAQQDIPINVGINSQLLVSKV
jgi:hypothetical protein